MLSGITYETLKGIPAVEAELLPLGRESTKKNREEKLVWLGG